MKDFQSAKLFSSSISQKCKLLARECSRNQKCMYYFRENRNLQMMFVTILAKRTYLDHFRKNYIFRIFMNFWLRSSKFICALFIVKWCYTHWLRHGNPPPHPPAFGLILGRYWSIDDISLCPPDFNLLSTALRNLIYYMANRTMKDVRAWRE